MKTLELENFNLSLITNEELQVINGGFISFINVRSIGEWIVGEVVDTIEGFKAGYNATVGSLQ